jgi:hypothetical protein
VSWKDLDRVASNIGKIPEGTTLPTRIGTVIKLVLILALVTIPIVCVVRGIDESVKPATTAVAKPEPPQPPEPSLPPPEPATPPRPMPPPLTPVERKVLRAEVLLAEIDPTLHSIRISWPNTLNVAWRWPIWTDPTKLQVALDALASVAGDEPALPELEAALRAYADSMRRDVPVIHDLVTRWNVVEAGTRPTADELVPVFERLGDTSQRIYLALRGARSLGTAKAGSIVALHDACVAATELLARMPNAVPVLESPGATAFLAKPPIGDLRHRGKACMRAAVDFADQAPELDGRSVELATQIGLAMFHEADAAKRASYVSWTGNIAHPVVYFVQRSPLR